MKTLITYFSAEGNTKALVERLAASIGADAFEIRPEKLRPYISGNPEILDARVFSVGASEEELKGWAESL